MRMRWLGLVPLLVVVALVVNEFRPVGAVDARQTIGSSTGAQGASATVPWPSTGQAALGGEDNGAFASSPGASPRPIASVAKVMTALVVLDEKPLQEGQQGPVIAVTAEDATEYRQEHDNGESVLPVQAGEQLSEYQALQGLLIPSGNNIAALLARWASGSVDAHVQKMNARAKALGLTRTTFTDVSGLSEKTVSVPSDLVRLGQEALKSPVLAGIVQQEQAVLPVAGVQPNVNYALGQDGIFGIKTGNITAGGAIYLFAGNVQLSSGSKLYLVGAVQGPDAARRIQEPDGRPVRPALGRRLGRGRDPGPGRAGVGRDRGADVPARGRGVAARLAPDERRQPARHRRRRGLRPAGGERGPARPAGASRAPDARHVVTAAGGRLRTPA
ncbi:MAG: D-alanyl-D-alanine carboxypeptidase [Chloroflexi bacterium]|nr:MAG: D-alanyl-D-alanine carboxypeptidase [Chloroflexota bacterium]